MGCVMARKNVSLHTAKRTKNDEHYASHFVGKVIYCNCDDPVVSKFAYYFLQKFPELGIKKLIGSCYKNSQHDLVSKHTDEKAVWWEYDGYRRDDRRPNMDDIKCHPLECDGDFRKPELIELLDMSDIVITNPPFSLFREYFAQLVERGKKFIIIGNVNAVAYKEIFPFIKSNKVWQGVTTPKGFLQPNGDTKKFGNIIWYTNLHNSRRNDELFLVAKYTSDEYQKYDNYDAIEVSQVKDIPCDYGGAMGVPLSFLSKHNPNQFEIIKFRKGDDDRDLAVNGKYPYMRILVRNKKVRS